MKTQSMCLLAGSAALMLLMSQCSEKTPEIHSPLADATAPNTGGFESQVAWGEHLVTVCLCHDCHSPKKFTERGMELDSTRLLSGHPAEMPPVPTGGSDLPSKGVIMSNDLTSWAGPWGTSFTANLTSDETGIGNWPEANFFTAIRHGKFKGLAGGRDLLPPMPWPFLSKLTDDEIKAIFAYLKSTAPIHNVVPPPLPPASVEAM